MNAPISLRPEDSGVFIASAVRSELRAAAQHSHCVWREVKLDGARSKAGFLAACARDLEFPAHFGGNWDALADAIGDLSWLDAKGYVIALDDVEAFACQAPDDWATALEILRNGADEWRARKRIFIVLLDRAPQDASLAVFSARRA